MAKRGIDEHPKTIEFAERLGIPVCYAVGPLELFWQYVAKVRPRGDIGDIKPSAIAHAIRFPGTGQQLVDALIAAGFLNVDGNKVIVHDWSEHADNAVHAALKKRGETFADGHLPYTRNRVREAKKEADVHEPITKEPHEGYKPLANDLQTVHEPDTNGLRSPVRVWPEPDTRYQIPGPGDVPGDPPPDWRKRIDGRWALLGVWLESPAVVDALEAFDRHRLSLGKGGLSEGVIQAFAQAVTVDRPPNEAQLVSFLEAAVADGMETPNVRAYHRWMQGTYRRKSPAPDASPESRPNSEPDEPSVDRAAMIEKIRLESKALGLAGVSR